MSVPQGVIFRYAFIWLLIASVQSISAIGLRELWSRTNVQSSLSASQLIEIDHQGNLFHRGFETETNAVLHKLSGKSGVPLWQFAMPSLSFRTDPQGNAYVIGRSNDTHFLKISGENGTIVWQKPLQVIHSAGTWLATSNDVLFLGVTQNGPPHTVTNDSCNIRKFSTLDGSLRWEQELHQVNTWTSEIAAGANGDVAIAVIKNTNYHVVKLSAGDGSTLWASTLTQTNQVGFVHRLTLDSYGNVFLAAEGAGRMYIAKLSAEDGSLVWERYHSEDSESRGIVIQMDNGDIVTWAWVWFQTDGQRQSGVYVARYRGTDGSLLWKRRFEPALPRISLSLRPPGMIKTSDNDLVFLAVTLSVGTEPDILQIHKIDSSTGETEWEWTVPKTDWPDAFATSSDRLALTYGPKTSFFHIGPELQTRLVDDQLEISWEPSDLGWQLDSSTLDLNAWNDLNGSTATNLIRINRDEPSRFFRLIRAE